MDPLGFGGWLFGFSAEELERALEVRPRLSRVLWEGLYVELRRSRGTYQAKLNLGGGRSVPVESPDLSRVLSQLQQEIWPVLVPD